LLSHEQICGLSPALINVQSDFRGPVSSARFSRFAGPSSPFNLEMNLFSSL
jgi:hypothetical protein